MWGPVDWILTSLLADHARTRSDQVLFLSQFASKAELLSYMLLFLVKMPFPPVTRPRNLSRDGSCSSPMFPVRTAHKKSSMNFRLKQLGKKASQYNSKLPTGHAASTLQLKGKCSLYTTPRREDRSSTNASRTSCFGASSKSVSASSSSKGMSSNKGSSSSTSSETCSPQASSSSSVSRVANKNSEAVSFSLRLTPEAVLLLQRRNHEKQLHGSSKPQFRQRELSAKAGPRPNVPLLKISLLNDRHQYDDVEYEDTVEQTVDQSVLLKCAEWLRGVEKAAETTTLSKVAKGSQKSI